MRDARQRSILAGLGISLWIPKLLVTRKGPTAASAIWRGQQSPEQMADVDSQLRQQPEPTAKRPSIGQAPNLPVQIKPVALVPEAPKPAGVALNKVATRHAPPSELDDPATLNTPVDTPLAQLSQQTQLRFSIVAVELKQWILLVDEASLQDKAAKQLWGNIIAAFNTPELLRFNWPLADGLRWQHPQGAKAALNGFLFRLGMDKRVGFMGQLQDDVIPDRIERLPTLEELITQPLKKRSLWLLLK